jgi:hypothetical protein
MTYNKKMQPCSLAAEHL